MGCYCRKVEETLDYWKEKRKPRLTRLIISVILYVIGLVSLILGIAGFSFLFILLGIIFCGIYTGLTWRKGVQENREKQEEEAGLTRALTEEGPKKQDGFWKKFLFFLLGMVLGIFITPVRIVIDIIGLAKTHGTVQRIKKELRRAKSIGNKK